MKKLIVYLMISLMVLSFTNNYAYASSNTSNSFISGDNIESLSEINDKLHNLNTRDEILEKYNNKYTTFSAEVFENKNGVMRLKLSPQDEIVTTYRSYNVSTKEIINMFDFQNIKRGSLIKIEGYLKYTTTEYGTEFMKIDSSKSKAKILGIINQNNDHIIKLDGKTLTVDQFIDYIENGSVLETDVNFKLIGIYNDFKNFELSIYPYKSRDVLKITHLEISFEEPIKTKSLKLLNEIKDKKKSEIIVTCKISNREMRASEVELK